MFNSVACLKGPSNKVTSESSNGKTLKEIVSSPFVEMRSSFFVHEKMKNAMRTNKNIGLVLFIGLELKEDTKINSQGKILIILL